MGLHVASSRAAGGGVDDKDAVYTDMDATANVDDDDTDATLIDADDADDTVGVLEANGRVTLQLKGPVHKGIILVIDDCPIIVDDNHNDNGNDDIDGELL
jgi:hypothetical protein